MFPNVRFMIAAVVASIVTLVGGFGLFANFRVSHEPLNRLAGGAPPLQLAADSTAPSAVTGDSFGPRFQVIQTQIAGTAAAPPPTHDDNTALSATETAPVAAVEPKPSPAESPEQATPVAPTPAAAPDAKQDDVAARANESPSEPQSESPPTTTDTAAAPPSESASPPAPQTTAVESPAEPVSAAADTTATVTPADPAPAAELPPQQPPTQQADQDAKPDTAAAVTPPAPPIATAPTTTAPTPPAAAPEAAPAPPARHKVVHRTRLAARPRPAAPSSSQQYGIGGPFVPAPNFAPAAGTARSNSPAGTR